MSILVETEVQKLPQINSVIGIDLGLKDFAILSNGTTCVNPKFSRSVEENWHKQWITVVRLHEKIVNARNDYLHKSLLKLLKTTTSSVWKICQ